MVVQDGWWYELIDNDLLKEGTLGGRECFQK